MSLSMVLTRGLLRLTPTATATAESTLRKAQRAVPAAEVPGWLRRIAHVEQREVNGRPVFELRPKKSGTGAHLIYLHGGAYVFSLVSAHWGIVGRLLRDSGASVTVPLYGLAPEHQVLEAYDLIDALYAQALTRVDRVYLGGDSAGAALALGQAMRRRDLARSLPAGVILFSPWLDISLQNPDVAGLAPLDHMIAPRGLVAAGSWWAGDTDARSPLVSPIFGYLGGLPPVHTFQGDRDILLADAVLLDERIRAAGGSSTLEVYPGAFHDFVGAPWTPEARTALRHAAAVLAAR